LANDAKYALGKTADFSIAEGEDIEDAQIVVGVRFWF
jgi:uncharacterized protein involved in copper resistance